MTRRFLHDWAPLFIVAAICFVVVAFGIHV